MTIYKGQFNWFGQLFTLYTRASAKPQAFTQFCQQLAQKVGYSARKVRQHFTNTTCFTIAVEKEKEKEKEKEI